MTGKKDDNALLIQTHWHVSVIKAHIQLKVLFAIPYDFMTESNFACDTILNVLEIKFNCLSSGQITLIILIIISVVAAHSPIVFLC